MTDRFEIDLYHVIEAVTVADDVDGGAQLAERITDAVVAFLPAAQPTVDRWALRDVLRNADPDWATDDHWMAVADALLASGVLSDTAQVRAEAYERGHRDGYVRGVRKAQATVDRNAPNGAALIAAERKRQVEAEGWTPEHDREHGWKSLRLAAWAYEDNYVGLWPWERQWWKPKGPLRNLVRAGALYQAAADVADVEDTRDYLLEQRDRVATQVDALLAEVLASGVLTASDREARP